MQRIAWVRRGIPLGVVKRLPPRAAFCVLGLLAEDASLAVGQLRNRVIAFCAHRIGWIVVRADKIDGELPGFAKAEEFLDPLIRRRRWTADTKLLD